MSDGETPGADELEGSDKRRHPRAVVSLLVQLRFNTVDDFLAEYSVDISRGGVFIRTKQPRRLGSLIYLRFALRDGESLVEGVGKVVRVVPADDPAAIPGMGVEFTYLPDEAKANLERLLAQTLGDT
jgi:molecular chaperone DnaK